MKNEIRDFVKSKKELFTIVGSIVLDVNSIGEGGNSLVYKGTWKNRAVAVKFLAFDNKHKMSRFYDEITIQLFVGDEDKGIGKILYFNEIDSDNGKIKYYVMPYHEHNLKTWRKKLSAEQVSENALNVFYNLLDILKYMETKNIVHRDIKPENILVNDNGNLILIDFGIAWFKTEEVEKISETAVDERVGNYSFSAPEQEHGGMPDKRMDFYAVGQLLQWFITGRTHRGTRRDAFVTTSRSLSRLDTLIDKLLSNNPQNRPSSTKEIDEYLKEESEGQKAFIRASKGFDEIHRLEKVLRKSFPGTNGLFRITEKGKIDFFLKELSSQVKHINLEWVGIEGNNKIEKIKKYGDLWVFNSDELLIDSLWIYRAGSPDREFFVVITKPSEKFLDEECNSDESGYASLYKGNYISTKFSNDGYMFVNGKSVSIEGKCEDRYRYYKPIIRFFGAECSSIIYHQNESQIRDAGEKILEGENPEDILKKLRHLGTNPVISMLK